MPRKSSAATAGKPVALLSDNRSHRRHYTILRVAKLATPEGEGLGLVRNVSEGGMMIDAYVSLKIGEPITVSMADGQELEARIVWQKGDAVGVQFERPATVSELLAPPKAAKRGKTVRAPRVNANRGALLHLGAKDAINVEVVDLSQRGAKIAMDAPLAREQDVRLELAGLPPINGTVRWAEAKAAGIAFHGVLGVRELMAWLATPPKKGKTP